MMESCFVCFVVFLCVGCWSFGFLCFFFNDTATTEIYTLSLHDALPICLPDSACPWGRSVRWRKAHRRSEEHTSELQSHSDLVCRLLLEKKKKTPPTLPPKTTKPNNTNQTPHPTPT